MRASQLDRSRSYMSKSKKKASLNDSRNMSRLNSSHYEHNQTKSRVVKPNRSNFLDDCNESMIHRLKDMSRLSRDSQLGELNKQLAIQQIDEESSSDEEYSIKPNPSDTLMDPF